MTMSRTFDASLNDIDGDVQGFGKRDCLAGLNPFMLVKNEFEMDK